MEMREHSLLPHEEQFTYAGPDWLLLLLDRCSPVQRDLVKLVLWRSWTTHNNITHQSGYTGIYDGVQSLLAMRCSLEQIVEGHVSNAGWAAPPDGWTKVNVDGSFVQATGEAGVGIIARNSAGAVIFSAWKVLFRCSGAAEAEAMTCGEGIRFASRWALGRTHPESDCARVVRAMNCGVDRSDVVLVKRECNVVANELAV
ncbi:hypothetical protein HU200_029085 [Digitaria exilis]|uniref:RNase H type-1 domain-containing protein n=1 Tax=Digitaria exilis TaxID=1010633 RepID=A0A835BU60_9POAL|nr:hypothetical protein HU200_029085 [Digitaria exilis]